MLGDVSGGLQTIPCTTGLRLLNTNVKSVLVYGPEGWKVTAAPTTKLQMFAAYSRSNGMTTFNFCGAELINKKSGVLYIAQMELVSPHPAESTNWYHTNGHKLELARCKKVGEPKHT